MKQCISLWMSSLSFALLILCSCEKDINNFEEYENPTSHLILEARNYFEDHYSFGRECNQEQ
jgi:hypothetical protein